MKPIFFLVLILVLPVHAVTITDLIVQDSGVDLHRNISVLSNTPTTVFLENLPLCSVTPVSLPAAGDYSVTCNEPDPVIGWVVVSEKGKTGTESIISQVKARFELNGATRTPTPIMIFYEDGSSRQSTDEFISAGLTTAKTRTATETIRVNTNTPSPIFTTTTTPVITLKDYLPLLIACLIFAVIILAIVFYGVKDEI